MCLFLKFLRSVKKGPPSLNQARAELICCPAISLGLNSDILSILLVYGSHLQYTSCSSRKVEKFQFCTKNPTGGRSVLPPFKSKKLILERYSSNGNLPSQSTDIKGSICHSMLLHNNGKVQNYLSSTWTII